MFERLRRKGLALAVSALTVASLGIATPALAEDDEVATYSPAEAMLTKVIDASIGTDAHADTYVFQFAGSGKVEEDNASGKLYSGGVEQDSITLKVDDVVPTIPDVTLNGVAFTDDNTLTNGQTAQAVRQTSIEKILKGVVFPHAGIYTYVVSEKSTKTELTDGTYINSSRAAYTLRIRVENTNTEGDSTLGDRNLTVAKVTIEQTKDDNGDTKTGKVDPIYPKVDSNGKITETADGETPGENELAGDSRGRFVDGFTFANEYIKGGSFAVKKLYDGDHSDRTKYSFVELAVYSEAASNPDAHGAVLTYVIEGDGVDHTESEQDSDGERLKLNGIYDEIPQLKHSMVKFNDQGWAYIRADLKEDSVIRITGEFGPYNPEYEQLAPNGKDRRMTLSTTGLVDNQTYYVIERHPGDYVPTGYEFVGENENADPRAESTGMKKTDKLTSEMTDPTDPIPENQPSYIQARIPEGALFVEGNTTGNATTVFVVNKLDESNVSPTGILINNLPYILMVGGPLAIFAIMFVSKRRRNAAA